jgi:hypothetical protein
VDVILTDVTKTWLDLRTALRCTFPFLLAQNHSLIASHLITADYEKIAAGYSRFFLWTSFRFYAPLRFIRAVVNRENLESVAGPFDKLKISSTQVALAYMMAWWLGVKL